MKERLLRAYLTEGELISDHATLARLAAEAGLPEDEVRELLAGDRFAAEVREDEHTAGALGISAVPFFVVDRKLGAAGAPVARRPARPAAPGASRAAADPRCWPRARPAAPRAADKPAGRP